MAIINIVQKLKMELRCQYEMFKGRVLCSLNIVLSDFASGKQLSPVWKFPHTLSRTSGNWGSGHKKEILV